MQLFHHGSILGGSWSNPDQQLIAILAAGTDSKMIQILPKFVKDFKLKANSTDEFIASLGSVEEFKALKSPKIELSYKNIIPIPNLLTKAFLELTETDPTTVAMKFLETMMTYDVAPWSVSQYQCGGPPSQAPYLS